MRKLPAGNYNIICKGKSGQLIESSPSPERKDGHSQYPINGILHIMANKPCGVVSDGSHIYFSTFASFSQRNSISVWEYRLYKYSIVDAARIWTTELIYVYHGIDDRFDYYSAGQLFVLGNYLYLHKGNAKYQRYLKSDGSKYGVEIESDTIEWFPPTPHPSYPPHRAWRGLYGKLSWGNNCFVHGGYIYAYRVYYRSYIDGGYDAPTLIYLAKLDSNFHQIGSAVHLTAPSGDDYYNYDYAPFMLAWDGSRLCGGGRWESYDGAFATWALSGGIPTNTWTYTNPYGEKPAPSSGCGGNNIIVGDQIWSLGEMHDGDRIYNPDNGRYYFTLNPEKNAMYHNSNWRQTATNWPYIHSSQPGNYDFYTYGSFYRGRYGEGFSYDHREKQIAKHNDKLYVTLSSYGPGGHDDMVGVHEMTTSGVYRNVHLV